MLLDAPGHALRFIEVPTPEPGPREVMIRVDRENGALHGACDPRADGYAIGY